MSTSSQEATNDPISRLPYDVVSHILSRLTTKDVVRTSILSRNWKYKWTCIHTFVIRDDNYDDRKRGQDFLNFVTNVLDRTHDAKIRSFRLSCTSNYPNTYFETWISQVLGRNVEDLLVSACGIRRLESVLCTYDWTTLTSLVLNMTCVMKVPVNNCFSNLKTLSLNSGGGGGRNLEIKSEREDSRMVFNFPVLEVLVFQNCEWLDTSIVEIHAPELIRFEMQCLDEMKEYEIRIFGPKLRTYESYSGLINNFVLSAPAVSSAALYHPLISSDRTLVLRAHAVLKGFPGLECLKLCGDVAQALLKSRTVLPTFYSLKELQVCFVCYLTDLLELLQLLPPLEVLRVNVSTWIDDRKFKDRLPAETMLKLKKVGFNYFSGKKVQLDFAKFVLNNARNLTEMVVYFDPKLGMSKDVRRQLPQQIENVRRQLLRQVPKNSNCVIDVKEGVFSFLWD